MQNKNALIDFIAGQIYPEFAEDTRNTPLPGSVTRNYVQSRLRRHRADLIKACRLDELDALDIPRMIEDTLYIDDQFVAELLDVIDPQPEPAAEVEHAVVAGDVIVAVGATPEGAAEAYAATGIEVRADGAGGWQAPSVSDVDWQQIRIIEISPELAAYIDQHGAPASWDTIANIFDLYDIDAQVRSIIAASGNLEVNA